MKTLRQVQLFNLTLSKSIFLFLLLLLLYSSCRESSNVGKKIYIASIVEIDPIVDLREGFKNTVLDSFSIRGDSVHFTDFNAQGDEALINQIVDQIIVDQPDLVYVLGTPFSQAIQNRDSTIKIVQGAATDPVSSGLADSWNGSGRNYAANSDFPPLERQIELMLQLLPNSSKIGVLYNSGESNSNAVIRALRNLFLKYPNLELIEKTISKSSDLPLVTESFIGNVDVLYIPPDNTVHSNFDIVGKICSENNIPLFATTSESINKGALAALALNFKSLGIEAGQIAIDILLNKQDISKIPILTSKNPDILINKSMLLKYNPSAISGLDSTILLK